MFEPASCVTTNHFHHPARCSGHCLDDHQSTQYALNAVEAFSHEPRESVSLPPPQPPNPQTRASPLSPNPSQQLPQDKRQPLIPRPTPTQLTPSNNFPSLPTRTQSKAGALLHLLTTSMCTPTNITLTSPSPMASANLSYLYLPATLDFEKLRGAPMTQDIN